MDVVVSIEARIAAVNNEGRLLLVVARWPADEEGLTGGRRVC